MKRILERNAAEPQPPTWDRKILEAGETALKRSSLILGRLESALKRASDHQKSPATDRAQRPVSTRQASPRAAAADRKA
ncbi:hypothetical protein [Kaistia sp. 32K]|uniref:hypothetical protein n=1 Tax=Kaistia sp. 32K TaxID=2795690 RepID=UPI001915D313|nr:hypothetical protein [Kaistia sp. 32K]